MNIIESQNASTDSSTPLVSRTESTSSTNSIKQWIFTLFKVLVSVALILWILRGTNLSEIIAAIAGANVPVLLLAFSLNVGGWIISAHRWRLLLAVHGLQAPISTLVKFYVVSHFFNNFLPSTIGGDTVRAYDAWRLGCSKSTAVIVIFVERLFGLLALMLFALVALTVSREVIDGIPFLQLWIGLGVVSMSMILWLIFKPSSRVSSLVAHLPLPLAAKLQTTLYSLMTFQGRKDALIGALGLSILLQANVVFQYYLVAEALALPLSLFALFLVIPLVTVIMMIPVSINAIGIRENAFVFFLAVYGVSKPDALAFAWLAYGIVLLQGLLGGVIYALRR